jgi:hypothetical protein
MGARGGRDERWHGGVLIHPVRKGSAHGAFSGEVVLYPKLREPLREVPAESGAGVLVRGAGHARSVLITNTSWEAMSVRTHSCSSREY